MGQSLKSAKYEVDCKEDGYGIERQGNFLPFPSKNLNNCVGSESDSLGYGEGQRHPYQYQECRQGILRISPIDFLHQSHHKGSYEWVLCNSSSRGEGI